MMFGALPLMTKIGGGIILVLLIALGVQTWRASSLSGKLEDCKAEKVRVEERLKVSNASIDEGLRQISDNNRRVQEANAKLEQARQQAAADIARANERWRSSGARVSALEASARNGAQDGCKVTEIAREALDGL